MSEVDQSQALLSIAEIALAIAGFGGIFVALTQDRSRPRGPADSYRLVLLLSTALAALSLSLVPVALLSFEVPETWTWPLASALCAAVLLAAQAVALRARRRHPEEIRAGEHAGAARAVQVLSTFTLLAQLANAVGIFGERAFGVFFSGLVFLVVFGGYLFARMLFLWRG
jgi:O-antigen/teichoic acid export membrane protein